MIIIDPGGHGDPSEIYAYVVIDEDGKSGICAAMTPMGPAPFVGMTRMDMKKWKPFVNEMRSKTKKSIKLIHYTAIETIEE